MAALSAAPAASALYSSSSSSSSSASPSGPPFDLVVGSDLIYYSYSPETPHSLLLLDTLTALTCQSSVIYLVLGEWPTECRVGFVSRPAGCGGEMYEKNSTTFDHH